ncbi:MAG: glycosyltransferase [Lachnospiraceae bacterium]|nr:glycosyltransferase [Lachnospiraceae bacterium]
MKVLFVINDLGCGGAQKSLVSLLNSIEFQEKDSVDLLVLDQTNKFFDEIPERIRILNCPEEIRAMFMQISSIIKSDLRIVTKVKGIISKSLLKLDIKNNDDNVQKIWRSWRLLIPEMDRSYDLAVSYVDGFANYYVIDKVKTKRKILWVHNEYEKLSYNPQYDMAYFLKAEKIITISESCVDSLKRTFPEMAEKIKMLPNLSSKDLIWKQSDVGMPDEYENRHNIIVSIGRLSFQKGFDMAIKAATILKDKKIDFCWFIIGEGELHDTLSGQISMGGLENHVRLLGNRKNPYPYIRYSTIFVQPSRYEGKSIVLDEAKILLKPIITTNYTTVYDSITDGVTGSIVKFNETNLAEAIMRLLSDKKLQNRYCEALKNEPSSVNVEPYLDLFRINK